jgi:hypothetical protein
MSMAIVRRLESPAARLGSVGALIVVGLIAVGLGAPLG